MSRKVSVRRRLWRDKQTGTTEDLLTIWDGGRFIKVSFDEARSLVDRVHDICDQRDRELREKGH